MQVIFLACGFIEDFNTDANLVTEQPRFWMDVEKVFTNKNRTMCTNFACKILFETRDGF